ncbi:recQ-mediated genome instability protein 1-like [Primulina huaijiensis]|uniref:recQ-mediated genome instability protein 1-like n=1 Tax=Primulina huaijiensis TaxID=1492673 RepID=UPI003CC756F2
MDGGSHFRVSDSPVNRVLERLELRLKRKWLDSCLILLQSSVPGFQGMDDSSKAKLCFGQFLCSDMNYSGAGGLPSNVHTLNLVDLKGFVLQVVQSEKGCLLRRFQVIWLLQTPRRRVSKYWSKVKLNH